VVRGSNLIWCRHFTHARPGLEIRKKDSGAPASTRPQNAGARRGWQPVDSARVQDAGGADQRSRHLSLGVFGHGLVLLRAVEVVAYILTALAAYLVGSIPTGYLVGKSRGVDIRTLSSGNIGATNVFRVLGKPAGIFVFAADALKGFVACRFFGAVIFRLLGGTVMPDSPTEEFLKITGGLFAIVGHNYTCFLKFKGGKGVATSAGVALALLPVALGVAFVVWILTLALTRYVSVASIAGAAVLPFAAWWPGQSSRTMIIVATVIGVLAIYKHRSNIQRLMNGTENRVGKKKEPAP
jgi:acyl phosphate:glycerol-3-phosphate acyltransferase